MASFIWGGLNRLTSVFGGNQSSHLERKSVTWTQLGRQVTLRLPSPDAETVSTASTAPRQLTPSPAFRLPPADPQHSNSEQARQVLNPTDYLQTYARTGIEQFLDPTRLLATSVNSGLQLVVHPERFSDLRNREVRILRTPDMRLLFPLEMRRLLTPEGLQYLRAVIARSESRHSATHTTSRLALPAPVVQAVHPVEPVTLSAPTRTALKTSVLLLAPDQVTVETIAPRKPVLQRLDERIALQLAHRRIDTLEDDLRAMPEAIAETVNELYAENDALRQEVTALRTDLQRTRLQLHDIEHTHIRGVEEEMNHQALMGIKDKVIEGFQTQLQQQQDELRDERAHSADLRSELASLTKEFTHLRNLVGAVPRSSAPVSRVEDDNESDSTPASTPPASPRSSSAVQTNVAPRKKLITKPSDTLFRRLDTAIRNKNKLKASQTHAPAQQQSHLNTLTFD